MTTFRKKNNVFKFVNKIIIMMSIFFLVFPSTINALDNNIDAFSTNEFFESTDFNLTLNGVNMKSVFIGQNALVYFSISTQVEYTSVDFEYYNLSNNSIKTFKLIGNNFSDNWSYFYTSFDSNDSFGVYELSKVTINSASGEKYIYERENNLSFVLGDLEFRNTSLLNNIRFQPSRVIAGESTLLSVEIVEDRDDIKCINFMPYQSEIETNNDCGIGSYGIMLSRVENTNIYQGIVNIPSNSTNGLYGIYKLVVYDNNNIPLEIIEPQEMYYEVYGGVEPDLLPPIVGELTISQTTARPGEIIHLSMEIEDANLEGSYARMELKGLGTIVREIFLTYDSSSGKLEGDLTVDLSMANGTWSIINPYVWDGVGNSMRIDSTTSNLEEISITISGSREPDLTSPVAGDLTISQTTAKPGENIYFSLEIEDENIEGSYARLDLKGIEPKVRFVSLNYDPINRNLNGVLRVDSTIANGIWKISNLYIRDGVGNVTNTSNFEEFSISVYESQEPDIIAPIINVSPYTTNLTNQNITVTVSTNEGTLNETNHTFSENGTFDFIATDLAGNVTTKTINITNIDKVKPVITVGDYIKIPTNQNITVTASTNEGTLNNSSHTFSENGIFDFIAEDVAGNVTTKRIEITNIDKVKPVIIVGDYIKTPTNQNITVTASTNEGTLNNSSHTFSENGTFDFIATDLAGNVTVQTVTINNIYKIVPEISNDNLKSITKNLTFEQKETNFKKLLSIDVLNDSDKTEFETLLKDMIENDKNFFDNYTGEEKLKLEAKLFEVYKNLINIEIQTNLEGINVEGLIFNSNLDRLIKGETLNIIVEVKNELTNEHQEILDNYLIDNQLEGRNIYSLDINLSNDGDQLTEFDNPITFTLPLPEGFYREEDLFIAHIHNGQVELLEVIFNDDETFSFTTNKLSSFSLVKATLIIPEIIEENKSNNYLIYLLLGGAIIIIILGAIFNKIKKED